MWKVFWLSVSLGSWVLSDGIWAGWRGPGIISGWHVSSPPMTVPLFIPPPAVGAHIAIQYMTCSHQTNGKPENNKAISQPTNSILKYTCRRTGIGCTISLPVFICVTVCMCTRIMWCRSVWSTWGMGWECVRKGARLEHSRHFEP